MERIISEKELACRKILDTMDDDPQYKACLDRLLTRWFANLNDPDTQREIDAAHLICNARLMGIDIDIDIED